MAIRVSELLYNDNWYLFKIKSHVIMHTVILFSDLSQNLFENSID